MGPPPDGNKRCAYLARREFVERNGHGWTSDSVQKTDGLVRTIARDQVSLEEIADWVMERLL